jgi:hypothetical protein
MTSVSGSWQHIPAYTTPLDQLTKEVLAEQATLSAGVNHGISSQKRADYLMRLDAIKVRESNLPAAEKPSYEKVVSTLDEKIRLLRSKESLENRPAPPQ